jgi:hypothetical protein
VPSRGAEEGRNEFLALGEVRSRLSSLFRGLGLVKTVTLVGGLGEFADWSGARHPAAQAQRSSTPSSRWELNRLSARPTWP